MPRPAKQDGFDKHRRLPVNRKARGMKLLRLWVPDPDAPGFAIEARRQAALLRGAPEEQEALAFIEAAMDTEGWSWGAGTSLPFPRRAMTASPGRLW